MKHYGEKRIITLDKDLSKVVITSPSISKKSVWIAMYRGWKVYRSGDISDPIWKDTYFSAEKNCLSACSRDLGKVCKWVDIQVRRAERNKPAK